MAAAVGEMVVLAGHVLVLLVIASFIAMGLEPVVAFLGRLGLRRGLAVAAVMITGVTLTIFFLVQMVPLLAAEASQVTHRLPNLLRHLQSHNSEIGPLIAKYHLARKAQSLTSLEAFGGVLHIGGLVLSLAASVVIIGVLVSYFLASLPQLEEVFYRLLPRSRRPRVGLLADEVLARVGGYALGNAVTSIVAMAANYVLLRVLGVPYALVRSVLVGLLDLVSLIGSIVGGLIVALIALAAVSLPVALATIGYHVAYRAFEDYVLNPRVLRKTVNVKRVVTVIAVLFGGTLLGIVGALIAVPVAAALQLVLTEVVFPSQDTR